MKTKPAIAPEDPEAKKPDTPSLNRPGARRAPVKRRDASVHELRVQIQDPAVPTKVKRIASLLSDDNHKYGCSAVLEAIWRLGGWKVRGGKKPRITANGIVARINEDDAQITSSIRREQPKGACNIVSSSKKLLEEMGLVSFEGQKLTGLAGENLEIPSEYLFRGKVDEDKVREIANSLVRARLEKRRAQNAQAFQKRQQKKLHAESENSTLRTELHAKSENSTLTKSLSMDSTSMLNPRSQHGAIIQEIYPEDLDDLQISKSSIQNHSSNKETLDREEEDSSSQTKSSRLNEENFSEGKGIPPASKQLEQIQKSMTTLLAAHEANTVLIAELRTKLNEQHCHAEARHKDLLAEIFELRSEIHSLMAKRETQETKPAQELSAYRGHFTDRQLDAALERWRVEYSGEGRPALEPSTIFRAYANLLERNFASEEARDLIIHASREHTFKGNVFSPLALFSTKLLFSRHECEKELPSLFRAYTEARLFHLGDPYEAYPKIAGSRSHQCNFRRFVLRMSDNMKAARREVEAHFNRVPQAWREGREGEFEYPPAPFDPFEHHRIRRGE